MCRDLEYLKSFWKVQKELMVSEKSYNRKPMTMLLERVEEYKSILGSLNYAYYMSDDKGHILQQIEEYLSSLRKLFDLPISPDSLSADYVRIGEEYFDITLSKLSQLQIFI